MSSKKTWVIVGLVLAAAMLRIVPHPPNFAPVAAMALFAGAHLADKRIAFLLPLLAMGLSDIFLGLHEGILLVYVCMCIVVAIGIMMRGKLSVLTITGGALLSAVVFFAVTNFGVWLTSGMYTLSVAGLMACYAAAIPFFQYTVASNLFYAALLFGGYALIETRLSSLQDAVNSA